MSETECSMSETNEPAIAIADALVSVLNDHEFSCEFQAERRYVGRAALTAASTLQVSVIPAGMESIVDTRREDKETHTVVVVVHQRVATTEPCHVDPLVELVREIHDFCRGLKLAGARVIRRQRQPLYDMEALAATREFLSYVFVECLLGYVPPPEAA
jgi:hypothetical protein